MAFVRAARIEDVPAGTIREFQVDGKAVALANVAGTVYAVENVCLHRGGPLGQGILEGKNVTCPWHGWQFDVSTGKSTLNPAVGIGCYRVEVRGSEIYVECG